jgi:hypothetical protein
MEKKMENDMKNLKTENKVDLNNVMLHVKGASYFGSFIPDDTPFTKESEIEFKEHESYDFRMIPDLLKEYGNPKVNDRVKRCMQEAESKAFAMDLIYKALKKSAARFDITVSYNDAIEVFEKMKKIITEKMSLRKRTAEIIDSFIKELEIKNDQFNKKIQTQTAENIFALHDAQDSSESLDEMRQTLQLWVDFTKTLSNLSSSFVKLTILDETIWNEHYNAVMNAIEELKTKGYSDKETHTVNL